MKNIKNVAKTVHFENHIPCIFMCLVWNNNIKGFQILKWYISMYTDVMLFIWCIWRSFRLIFSFSCSEFNELPRRPTICIEFSLTHPPAVLLDIERESPIKWCMAPEANNRRHKRSCKTGVRGQFLCVDWDRSGRKPRRYKIIWWRKRYFSPLSTPRFLDPWAFIILFY